MIALTRRQVLITATEVAAAASVGSANPAKTRVGLVPSTHPTLTRPSSLEEPLDYPRVREMVWKAIEYGRPRAGSLHAKIRSRSWVVIKPNIVFLRPQSGYAPGDITDMRVTQAVLEYVARNSRAGRITIAEGGSYRGLKDAGTGAVVQQNGARVDATSFDWGDQEFPGWGSSLGGMLERFSAEFPDKRFDYVDLGYDAVRGASGKPQRIEVPRSTRGVGGFGERTDYFITNTIRNCDFLVNVPVLKIHTGTAITCCLKNYVGAAPREAYAAPGRWTNAGLHQQHSLEGRQDSFICDLASFHPPDYNVLDGIRGLQYNAHNNGRPDQTVRSNLILAGEDPVAIDAVAAYLTGFNPWDLDYLHMAAQRDMGTFEMHKIEVIGVEPDRHRRTWGKPDRGEEMWHGRCNREWRVTSDASTPLPSWKRYTNRTDTLNLTRWAGNAAKPETTYGAAVRVIAEGSRKAHLWLGVRGRITANLNGQNVLQVENLTRYRVGQFRQRVELRSGENLLVFEVRPRNEEAQLSVLLVGPRNDGDTVDGIRWVA